MSFSYGFLFSGASFVRSRSHESPQTATSSLFSSNRQPLLPRQSGKKRNSKRSLHLEALEDRQMFSVNVSGSWSLAATKFSSVGDFRAVEPIERVELAAPTEVGVIHFLGAGPSPEDLRILEPTNNVAADTTNTDQLWPGGNLGLDLTGAGLTVGVWEASDGNGNSWVRDTHEVLAGRVTFGDTSGPTSNYSDHATHVAGTIAAAHMSPAGRSSQWPAYPGNRAWAGGMASEVNIRSYSSANDIAEMGTDAAMMVASNHSYGSVIGWTLRDTSNDPTMPDLGVADVWWADRSTSSEASLFGQYDGTAQSIDQVLYDNPNLLSVWSAGNDRNEQFTDVRGDNTYVTWLSMDPGSVNGWSGPGWYQVPNQGATSAPQRDGGRSGFDALTPDKVAKNSLVVGAVDRVVLDPYAVSDVSTLDFSSYGPTDDGRIKPDVVAMGENVWSSTAVADDTYAWYSGTSMATPNVTGTSVLLIEHYEDLFGVRPRSATTKGLLTHTAFDAGTAGPDYRFGWGLVDAAAAANLLTNAAQSTASAFVEENLYVGSEHLLGIYSDGSQPIKTTISWTDPAGPTQSGLDDNTPVLVNDLDLWVEAPDGSRLNPWTLDPTAPASAAVRSGANHLDNIEQVLIDTPVPGIYTIHVGHTGASIVQDYSLIVDGGTRPDINGPVVADTTHLRAGATFNEPMDIRVTFNEPIDPNSFTADLVNLFDARGNLIPINDNDIQPVVGFGNDRFDIKLSSVPVSGYDLTISPGVRDVYSNLMNQDTDAVNGEWTSDQFATRFEDITGPWVAGREVSTQNIEVSFSEAIDAATFTREDLVRLTGSRGAFIGGLDPTRVANSGGLSYDIPLSATPMGGYDLTLGPDVIDLWGNRMDQNRMGLQGEIPHDQYHDSVRDDQGPWIKGSALAVGVTSAIFPVFPQHAREILVAVDEALDMNTFTSANARIVGPNGAAATIADISEYSGQGFNSNPNDHNYAITFLTSGYGDYGLTIMPDVTDLYGNGLDTDQDTFNGESAEDIYVATFTLHMTALQQPAHATLEELDMIAAVWNGGFVGSMPTIGPLGTDLKVNAADDSVWLGAKSRALPMAKPAPLTTVNKSSATTDAMVIDQVFADSSGDPDSVTSAKWINETSLRMAINPQENDLVRLTRVIDNPFS